MSELLVGLLTVIIVAVIGYAIMYAKKHNFDGKVENVYRRYSLLFKISGELIRSLDEQLYKEMQEAIERMQEAYESPQFTSKDLNEIIKECQDVFDRAEALIDERRAKD